MPDSNAVLHPDSVNLALRARAEREIPGGFWGCPAARILPHGYLEFFDRTEGFHLVGADVRRAFGAETLRHGAYLHTKHTVFLPCAHTEAHIGRVFDALDAGFRHAAH
jgi:hypothetical protein